MTTTTTSSKGNGKEAKQNAKAAKAVETFAPKHETLTLAEITVNEADNSRARIDPKKVKELAESIKAHGLLQAPIVQRRDGKCYLVAGYQRFAALRMLGAQSTDCAVIGGTHADALLLNFVENDVREDLTPPEQAKALHRLVKAEKIPAATVIESCGKSKKHVENLIRMREKLTPECWEIFEKGRKQGDTQLWDVAHWLRIAASKPTEQMLDHKASLEEDGTPKHPGKEPRKAKDSPEGAQSEPAIPTEPDAEELEEKAYKALVARCKQWLTWAGSEAKKEDGQIDEEYFDGAREMFATVVLRVEKGGERLSHFDDFKAE